MPMPVTVHSALDAAQFWELVVTLMQEWMPSVPSLSYHTDHVASMQGQARVAPNRPEPQELTQVPQADSEEAPAAE